MSVFKNIMMNYDPTPSPPYYSEPKFQSLCEPDPRYVFFCGGKIVTGVGLGGKIIYEYVCICVCVCVYTCAYWHIIHAQ